MEQHQHQEQPADVPPPPDPAPILNLINGFREFKVLSCLTKMGVLDALEQQQQQQQQLADSAGGAPAPVALASLAASLDGGVSLDGLGRLCDAGVALGLLAGSSTAGYALTPVARTYLLTDAALSLSGYVRHSDDVLYPLWRECEAAVRTGRHVWRQAFGAAGGADVFGQLYADGPSLLRFLRGMHSFAALSAQAVTSAFAISWPPPPPQPAPVLLVDLGGATGALAAAACELHPQLHAVVVDLPHVCEAARQHFAPKLPADVSGRLTWVAGDMFGPAGALPGQASGYMLSRILHDWAQPQCEQLLETVFSRLLPGGVLLVAEMLLDDATDGTSPAPAVLQSLNMLTQTHGRERTLSGYRNLLTAAGFERVEGRRTGTPLDAIVAYKPLQLEM